MNLDEHPPFSHYGFSFESLARLTALDKKRKLSENRYALWALAPVIIAIPFAAFAISGEKWLGILFIISIFAVILGLGAYIHVVLPNREQLSTEFKKLVVPEMMRATGITGDFSLRNGLSVDSFLKGGLYKEKYSHFERYDSIVGSFQGKKFGLYELAVQISSGLQGVGLAMPSSHIDTNVFYGWVLHVPVKTISGNVYIIPRQKKTTHETDVWTDELRKYYLSNAQPLLLNDAEFDSLFFIFSGNAKTAHDLLKPSLRELLKSVYHVSTNAPAFSFCGNRAYMHIGIANTGFDPKAGAKYYPVSSEEIYRKLCFVTMLVNGLTEAGEQPNIIH